MATGGLRSDHRAARALSVRAERLEALAAHARWEATMDDLTARMIARAEGIEAARWFYDLASNALTFAKYHERRARRLRGLARLLGAQPPTGPLG